MNILFASGYFGAIPIANNIVAMRLAKGFTAQGHRCFIMGLSPEHIGTETLDCGTPLIRVGANRLLDKSLAKYYRFQQQNPGKTAKDFALRNPLDAGVIGLMNSRCFNSPKAIEKFAKDVERLIATEKIDAVITICFPFDVAHYLLRNLTAPVVKVYYQLDPHGLHVYYDGEVRAERIRLERQAMECADIIFTTNELYPQYAADANYQPYLSKCVPIGFPVFFPTEEGDKKRAGFSDDMINIVFCGTLDRNMREPTTMLQQVEKVIQKLPNVKFYFAGTDESALIAEMAARYPAQLVWLGSVPADVADNLMNSADVLLNVSNMANNMVASKIFTYFATGKPVLNFQKIMDCANQAHFEKYPLAFTFCEPTDQDKTDEICAFLLENHQNRVPYAQSEAVYRDFTLSKVAEAMLAQIATKLEALRSS